MGIVAVIILMRVFILLNLHSLKMGSTPNNIFALIFLRGKLTLLDRVLVPYTL